MTLPNLKTKRVWDSLWAKFVSSLPGPGVASPFGVRSVVIDEPLTLYVATTGSGSASGTQTDPFATIQAAIDYLKDFIIAEAVIISVGPGDFAGFEVDGLQFSKGVPLTSPTRQSGGTLVIQGTTTTLYTGTITSTATTNTVQQTMTDSGASFGVNAHIGRILWAPSVTTFPAYRVAVSNTATTIDFPGGSWGANAASYQILQLDTRIVSSASKLQGIIFNSVVASELPGASMSATTPTVFRITLKLLEVNTNAVSGGICIQGANTSFQAEACRFISGTGGSATIFNLTATSSCVLCSCYLEHATSTSGVIGQWGGTAQGTRLMGLFDCYLRKITNLDGIWISANGVNITNCAIEGATVGIRCSANRSLPAISAWIINCTTGITVGASFGTAGGVIDGFSGAIVGGTTGISLANGGLCIVSSGNIGSTTAISVTTGGRCKVASSVTVTGSTTELSVDAVTSTLATMRAASPKTFPTVANIYGSLVYE